MLTFLSVLSTTCLLYLNVVKIRYSSPAISFTTVPTSLPPPPPSHLIKSGGGINTLACEVVISFATIFSPSHSLLFSPLPHSLLFHPSHSLLSRLPSHSLLSPTSFVTAPPPPLISWLLFSPSISLATIFPAGRRLYIKHLFNEFETHTSGRAPACFNSPTRFPMSASFSKRL